MANINIDIELDNDTIKELLDIYIRENMSSGSYEVFKMNKNGFMLAAIAALKNEAIVTAITEGLKYDNLFKTQD